MTADDRTPIPAPDPRRGPDSRQCEKHGPFERMLWACPACEKELEDQRRYRRALELSGLTGRLEAATLATYVADTPDQRVVLQAVEQFANLRTPAGGLILAGRPGTGKTHLAAACVRAWRFEHKRTARIATAREIVREIRSTWGRFERDEFGAPITDSYVIEGFAGYDLLAIDDLAAEAMSDADRGHILDVVDRRWKARLPTITSTNLSVDLLRAAAGDRIVDRLLDNARFLRLGWGSHRGWAA